jgi:hypothetical protein
VLLAAYEIGLQRIKPAPPGEEAPPASGPRRPGGDPVAHQRNLDQARADRRMEYGHVA